MAAISAEDFMLYDTVPGPVNPNMSRPVNGFDSTHSCNVTTPTYDPGTKIMVYQDVSTTTKGARSANFGWYTCVYGKYVCSTNAVDVTAADLCTISCGSDGHLGAIAFTREITGSNILIRPPMVVACADMTPNSYGWFWCEGICPQEDITGLEASAYPTDGSVGIGDLLVVDPASTCEVAISVDISGEAVLHVGWSFRADS